MTQANSRWLYRRAACSLAFIICLSAHVPFPSLSQSDDETALRKLAEKFFAVYRNSDLDGLMGLWSEKSPELAASRLSFQQIFAANKVELKNLQISKVMVGNSKATVRVVADISALDLKTGKAAVGFGVTNRTLHCIKEGGEWKVWQYVISEHELAAELASMKKYEEQKTLLEAEKELVTVELVKGLLDQSNRLTNQGKHQEALNIFGIAADIAGQVGDRSGMATALRGAGRIHYSQSNYTKALEQYQKSLKISEEIGDKDGLARTLNNIGIVYGAQGNYTAALEQYQKSLKIREELSDKSAMAGTLNNIGVVYRFQSNYAEALEQFQKSLKISEEIGDKAVMANALTNIGVVRQSQGDYAEALAQHQKSLKIREEISDKYGVATTLNNLGFIYQSQGKYAEALEQYQKSLKIKEEFGDKNGIADALTNIGILYRLQGNYAGALEQYQKSLKIKEEIGNKVGIANALSNSGNIYQLLDNYPEALMSFQKSLKIHEEIGHKRGSSIVLNNLGFIYQLQGKHHEALESFQKSLKISEEIGEKDRIANTLRNIGEVHQSRGDYAQALEITDRAALIAEEIGAPDELWQIRYGASKAYHGLNRLREARQNLEEAIKIIESVRGSIAGGEARATYFARVREPYEAYIDLLMQMHRQNPAAGLDIEAFAVSERARARSLLELLTESRADIRQGVEPSLLERERSLQQRLNARAAAQVDLLNRKHTSAQAEAAAKEIASLTDEYEEIRAQIRKSSPRYDALTQPQPLNLTEIQQQVLDPETLLLEYSLGNDASYLFLVSQTSITSYQLPKRAEIEAATRRAHELLTAPQPRPGETAAKRQARIKEAKANYWPHAAALSRMLLGPVASQLGAKRLLIVADGALQYLPFGALPVPDVSNSASPHSFIATTPMMVEHEIVHLPSASTLAVLRRDLAGRQPASEAVAVLADPVFSADDARVKPGNKAQAGKQTPSDLTRSINDVRGELRRLLMTRDEAEAILSATPRNAGLAALDFRANRATATGEEMSRYRIVHFATHGLLNSEHPELSGLVLSLVDEYGQPQDGFFRMHEIFNLRLPAELVVLSACQTGLGKEIKGEGLVGLTRGFMYAGAARVVASLWQVNDAATAELMKRFYHRMLKDGMRPAAALRAAQIEMWKKPQWQSPFYWGAFVLQGEWK